MRSRYRAPGFVTVVAMLLMMQAAPVRAWGPLGHRLTGRLAEEHLTPKARAAVAELLEPGESMAEASTWADEHRRDIKGSGTWHYVDVPLDQDRYDDRFAGDAPEKGNIVPKIREFRAVLKDRSRPLEERRVALRFLIHLVEDLHMPLHVGDNHDRGGNDTQVRFFDQGTNMHRLWDGDMIARGRRGRGLLAGRPDRDGYARGPREGDGRHRRGVGDREPAGGQGGLQGPRDRSEDQARDQARRSRTRRRTCRSPGGGSTRAGVRLAKVLNEVFGEG